MVELNEDCLNHIFGYLTPIEWIQISEVCQFWKSAVSRQWNKFTEVSYTNPPDVSNKPSIPAETAHKIALHATASCNVLTALVSSESIGVVLQCKHFFYKIEDFNLEETIKLWAENATELTEVHFIKPPRTELLQLLLNQNQIKTLAIYKSDCFWTEIPTASIENLQVRFINPGDDFVSFQGHFPNLKKLFFGLVYTRICELHNFDQIFSLTLPYVLGIQSLKLNINLPTHSTSILNYINQFSDLEELELILRDSSLQYDTPSFHEKLHLSCPKLRVVSLDRFYISEDALYSMLSLPNLESLDLRNSSVTEFRPKENIPELKNLSTIDIVFYDESTVDATILCNAVKNMIKLQKIRVFGILPQHSVMLTCEAISLAVKLGKDVVVETEYFDETAENTRLKIESKNCDESNGVLRLNIRYCTETYLDDIQTFVRNNFENHRSFIF